MLKTYIVHLIQNLKLFSHEVNCPDKISAQTICENMFNQARVIDITEA